MNTFLYDDDLQIKEAFSSIMSSDSFSDYIKKISANIRDKKLDKQNLDSILNEYNIRKIEDIKDEILDMLLAYINFILNDNIITEKEAGNFKLLKRFFKIKEGNFYHSRYKAIKEILNNQFKNIYSDNQIDLQEALLKVSLQELFDLSYDQFLEIANKEAKAALQRGADFNQLDTVFIENNKNNFFKRLFLKIFTWK